MAGASAQSVCCVHQIAAREHYGCSGTAAGREACHAAQTSTSMLTLFRFLVLVSQVCSEHLPCGCSNAPCSRAPSCFTSDVFSFYKPHHCAVSGSNFCFCELPVVRLNFLLPPAPSEALESLESAERALSFYLYCSAETRTPQTDVMMESKGKRLCLPHDDVR